MQARVFLWSIALSSLVLAGCSNEAPAVAAKAPAEQEAPPAAVEGGTPKIAAAEALFNFGGVKPGATVEHVFTIKNEGTGDLHIEGVKKT